MVLLSVFVTFMAHRDLSRYHKAHKTTPEDASSRPLEKPSLIDRYSQTLPPVTLTISSS